MLGIPLWSVLTACLVFAGLLVDWRLIRASCALLANWGILTLAAALTGNGYNVPLNMSVDWVTAILGFCVLDIYALTHWHRVHVFVQTKGQALMLLTFGLGMIFHADHLLKLFAGWPIAKLRVPYWYRFHFLAWVQAGLLIGWEGHAGYRALVRALGNRRGLQALRRCLALVRLPRRGEA